jgi:hypothetical protein
MNDNDDELGLVPRERLVRVETRLEALDEKFDTFAGNNDRRLDELKTMVTVVMMKPSLAEKVIIGTGGFISTNWKTIVGVALVLATGGIANALDFLR